MKVRNGFVSNSSSSSFVIVANKEHFENEVKKCEGKLKEFIDELKQTEYFNESKFMDYAVVSISGWNSCVGESEFSNILENSNIELDADNEDAKCDLSDEYYNFLDKICDNTNLAFRKSTDY